MLERFNSIGTAKRQCELRRGDISVKGGLNSVMLFTLPMRVPGRLTP